MAIIMGVDSAVSNTGIVVIDTKDFKLLYQTTIKNPPGSTNNHRVEPYVQIRGGIRSIIREYKVEAAFIEATFCGKNPIVVAMLHCANLASRLTCFEEDIPFHIVPVQGENAGWRWFTLGGNYKTYEAGAAKIANKARLNADLGVVLKNEHQADAAGIALGGWFFMTGVDFRDVLGVPKPDFTRPTRVIKDKIVKPKKPRAKKS